MMTTRDPFDAGNAVQGSSSNNSESTAHGAETTTAAELNVINLDAPMSETQIPPLFDRCSTLVAPSLDEFLSRRVTIGSATFSSSDSPGAQQYFTPIANFLAAAPIQGKILNYTYLRGTFEITIVTATTPSAYGMYVWNCLPNAFEDIGAMTQRYGSSTTQPNSASMYNCLQCDWSTVFDASTSNTVQFSLPFTHIFESANMASYGTAWGLTSTCFLPVTTALSAAGVSCTATIYGRFLPGYELSVPTYQAGPNELSVPALPLTRATNLGSVPIISPILHMLSRGARVLGNTAAALGYTIETKPVVLQHFMNWSYGNTVSVEGEDNGYVSSMGGLSRIADDPRINGGDGKDELSYASLFPRRTYYGYAPYTNSSTVGSVLIQLPVTPMLAKVTYPNSTTAVTNLSPAGFTGLCYDWWRGTVNFHIYVPVSKFHRGRLQVFWSPTKIPTTPGESITSSTYTHIFDVTPGKWMVFKIGYQNNHPMLHTYICDGVNEPNSVNNYCNGYFGVRAVTPFEGMAPTNSTNVYIFTTVDPDMEFLYPCTNVSIPGNVSGTAEYLWSPFNTLTYQSGALGDESAIEEQSFTLVPVSAQYPLTEVCFGETFQSVRPLMQKPSYYRTPTSTIPSPSTIVCDPLEGPTGFNGTSLGRYFSRMFYSVATSERLKLLDGASGQYYAVGRLQMGVSTSAALYNTMPSSYCGDQFGLEYTIPYYNPYKFIWGCYPLKSVGTGTNKTIPTSYNLVAITIDSGYGVTSTNPPLVYHSFGDDTRVALFCAVPQLVNVRQASTFAAGGIFGFS